MVVPSLDRALVGRVLVAAVCVAFLFVVRWDASLQHFDFQVWRAAGTMAERGDDPYDIESLNVELHENPEIYGDHWRGDRWQTDWRMHLFSPPVWLTELRLLGNSALAMSLVGAGLTYAAIVALSRAAPTIDALGYLAGTTWIFLFPQAATTFRLGQSGLLLCGLVGASLLLAARTSAGVPAAALLFKPHIAAAALLPELLRGAGRRRAVLLVPSALLAAATFVLFPISLWAGWVGALFSSDRPAASVDMSLRTLSTRFPLPESSSTLTLLIGVAAAVWLTSRWRHADPRLLTLLSLALVIYSSGHAFGHDWLWIVFIPIVGRWSLGPTMFAAIGAASVFTIGDDWTAKGPTLVNLTSALALAVTVYLIVATSRSARRSEADRSAGERLRPIAPHGVGNA